MSISCEDPCTDYGRDSIHNIRTHKDKPEIMNQMSKAKKTSCSISYYSELQYLSEWSSLFPQKWKYSIDEFSKPDSICEFESFIE